MSDENQDSEELDTSPEPKLTDNLALLGVVATLTSPGAAFVAFTHNFGPILKTIVLVVFLSAVCSWLYFSNRALRQRSLSIWTLRSIVIWKIFAGVTGALLVVFVTVAATIQTDDALSQYAALAAAMAAFVFAVFVVAIGWMNYRITRSIALILPVTVLQLFSFVCGLFIVAGPVLSLMVRGIAAEQDQIARDRAYLNRKYLQRISRF